MRGAFIASLLLSLAMTGSLARAETGILPACLIRPAVAPRSGAQVPANLPAFLFQAPSYPTAEHPIAWHAIELRESGGTLVPHRVETFEQDRQTYAAILPERPIATGVLVVSFLDDCPSQFYDRLLDPPVRNNTFIYQVTEASPLPTRLGTAAVRGVDYSRPRGCADDTAAWVEIEVKPTPEVLAFQDALTWRAATGDGVELWGQAGDVRTNFFGQPSSTFLFQQRAGCGPPRRWGRLGSGHSEVVYGVELFKGPVIEPARAPVDVDCAGVPDADVCALDASAVGGETEPPGGGCACGVGASSPGPGAASLLLAGLLFSASRSRRRRRSR